MSSSLKNELVLICLILFMFAYFLEHFGPKEKPAPVVFFEALADKFVTYLIF